LQSDSFLGVSPCLKNSIKAKNNRFIEDFFYCIVFFYHVPNISNE